MGMVYLDFYHLLFPYSELHPPIEEQLYLFMKRFRTQPSEFFGMDYDLRMRIFFRELAIVKKEYEDNQKMNE